METMTKAVSTVCIAVCLPVCGLVLSDETPAGGRELARFLLDKMSDTRRSINNFKCTVLYHDYVPLESRRRLLERAAQDNARARERIERMISNLDKRDEHKLEEQHVAIDREGRTRREILQAFSDADGHLIEVVSRRTATWDGHSSILYIEGSGQTAAELSDKRVGEVSETYRQPLRAFGGIFRDRLAKAVADEAEIGVERTGEGRFRVRLSHGANRIEVATLDPSQGYSVVLGEHYVDGKLIGRSEATFKEAIPGVWFPMEAKETWFSLADPSVLERRSTVRVSDILLNDPCFYEGVFHVDFAKGTRVVDHRSGLTYVVGDPLSAKLGLGAPDVNKIATDALEGIDRELTAEVQLLIPKMDLARKGQRPFIADLAGHALVYSAAEPGTEEGLKHLADLGKGDLAWDGKLIATRGARILTAKKEISRPLKTTKGLWAESYELPQDVKLPYWMVIVTKEKLVYLLSVRSIEEERMQVTYRRVAFDEISLYVQQSAQRPQKP